MSEVSKHDPGTFCWVELSASSTGEAKSFYSKLFGWTVHEMPMGDQGSYFIFQKNGKDVAAMYAQLPEEKKGGIPPHWNNYIAVSSADSAAAKARSLGATILAAPFDVNDAGRMAVVQDAQLAVFLLWDAKNHIGARLINEPGALCWNELYTNDIEASRDFYSKLFGWKLKISPEYTEVHVGERGIGGMMQISEKMSGMPPCWLPYFTVENTDAAFKRAQSGGIEVYVPPTDIPHVGRFAMFADPQGAGLAIIALAAR